MEQKILTERQQQVLQNVAKEEQLNQFYLSGGTALSAYYLHHRISDDLDFFCAQTVNVAWLHAFAAGLKHALQADDMQHQRLYDRNMYTFGWSDGSILKIEFTRYDFPQLDDIGIFDGVRVDSLRDLGANKLMTLIDRFDPKDFVDLYVILQSRALGDIRDDVKKKFDTKLDSIVLGGEFAKVGRIESLPHMLMPLTVEQLKEFFREQAATLKAEILDE